MKTSSIRCLVTAGPTREFFDPVRFLSNPSSGKTGYALAEAAAAIGWQVDLVSGPTALPAPSGVALHHVESGQEMLQAIETHFDDCDILIMSAAVTDYRPRSYSESKLKKSSGVITVELEPVTDILQTVAARKTMQIVVGFAAETGDIEKGALAKMSAKHCDFLVANRVDRAGVGFGADTNTVILFGPGDEMEKLGPADKSDLARILVARFARFMEHTKTRRANPAAEPSPPLTL